MEKSKNINLGTFTLYIEKGIQEKMDNDLKIAILNYLSSSPHPWINAIRPYSNPKSDIPVFEEIFYYIKNLPANRVEEEV